jgi:hypothetical protein
LEETDFFQIVAVTSQGHGAVSGAEGNGLTEVVAKACSHTMRIDMVRGVDSLGVPIVERFSYGLKEREQTNSHLNKLRRK